MCNIVHLLHTFAHDIKRAKTDAATQNNCPACYSLSRDQKPFNTKVRRGAIFTSKCTSQKLFVAGLCLDPLGELMTLPHTTNWIG